MHSANKITSENNRWSFWGLEKKKKRAYKKQEKDREKPFKNENIGNNPTTLEKYLQIYPAGKFNCQKHIPTNLEALELYYFLETFPKIRDKPIARGAFIELRHYLRTHGFIEESN